MTLTSAELKYKRLPHEPGVYLMKDSGGRIIYIGKAKDLSKRVGSYFTKRHQGRYYYYYDNKTARLVAEIADIEFVVTDNETEAFLLEANLIRRYRPEFNIDLKDNNRYTYLKITDEPFPRLLVTRRNRAGEFPGPRGKVYGPFVRGSSKYLTVGLLRKLFKVRVCNRLPKVPCLQYFIKNCDAPCIAKVTQQKYMEGIESLRAILEGRSSVERFAQEMEMEMRRASDIGDYERAREIRDTLFRLNDLKVRQKIDRAPAGKDPDEEYMGIMRDCKKGVAHVMTFKRSHGVISDRKKFEFDLVGDNSLSTFLLQYYSSAPTIPHVVYVSEEPESKDVLQMLLEKLSGRKVRISLAHGPEKRQLMDLIMRNLAMYVERGYAPAVVELKKTLSLSSMPETIDCFDVSNLGTQIAVGSCVRFANGKPHKAGYRRFKIETVKGQNDFAMIGELVRRRYSEGNDIPDLVVVDGGKGQLAAASASLRAIGLADLPCVGLAKENEEIYVQGVAEPLALPRSNLGLRVLQHARDEAHRFGLAYNRRLRKSLSIRP
ncbi:MAG: excinuclease ABC subunit C [Nitrososphaera sp.]